MTDLTALTIAEAAQLIGARSIRPSDLTAAHLERIDRLNGVYNAFITVTHEGALEDAARADQEIAAGRYRGPLHGIPMALKDIIATAGIRTTCGSRIFEGWVPDRDAGVVQRLRDAGSVLLGKLNTHEFAMGATNANPHFGPARNPWDTDRVSGGSSGGAGAAVTARLAMAAIGTDTGGSIRIPAALCGCVGLKPTYGRVSKSGVFPLLRTALRNASRIPARAASREERCTAAGDLVARDICTLGRQRCQPGQTTGGHRSPPVRPVLCRADRSAVRYPRLPEFAGRASATCRERATARQ